MADGKESPISLPTAQQRELEALVARFEQAWLRGEQPAITAFLLPGKEEVLVELVHTDLQCRLKAGEEARVEGYLERFPALGQNQGTVLSLIESEYDLRRRREPALDPGEYARRFPQFGSQLTERLKLPAGWTSPGVAVSPPILKPADTLTAEPATLMPGEHLDRTLRCPHCHQRLPADGAGSNAKITCPSCGARCDVVDARVPLSSVAVLRCLNRFELIGPVGTGAFGQVWKARDTRLNRLVAIKVPHRDRVSPVETEKFLREARLAAGLKHPGIVGVYEVGQDGDTIFIVSEYVEGESLAARLRRQPLTHREAAELCLEIADALNFAHEAGVIHRDLKPANVLLDGVGKPHITDFGLAKRELGEVTMTFEGQILGTPAYMSPEQALGRGHQADRRSDVYSLGIILFELLSNERPFRGNTHAILQQVIHDEAPSPRKFDSLIPADLERICLCCLRKDPSDRYPTAKALAQDLRCWLEGASVPVPKGGWVRKAARWARREPVTPMLSATVVALLVIIGILVAIIGRGSFGPEPTERSVPKPKAEIDPAELAKAIVEMMENKRQAKIDPAELAKEGAEGAAAKIKKEELEARKRITAVRFLATVDCHFWPEAEATLIGALRGDRNEQVRLEAALALGKGKCITGKTIAALRITIAGSDVDENPSETSEKVKAAARTALDYSLKHYKEPKPRKSKDKNPEKI